MKKIIAILMALCLLTGFAMAEDINWSDVEATVADSGIEGDFFSIGDIGVKMFIPSVFQEVELSEDDVAEGYICYLTTEDEAGTVAVTYADVNGMSLEDYAGYLPEVRPGGRFRSAAGRKEASL